MRSTQLYKRKHEQSQAFLFFGVKSFDSILERKQSLSKHSGETEADFCFEA